MKKKLFLTFVAVAHLSIIGYTQNVEALLRGRVYSSFDRKPVEFATVMIPEKKIKVRTGPDGSYEINVGKGEYTVLVRSEGYSYIKRRIVISMETENDFYLHPVSIRGGALTITGERPKQKLSRRTMTVQQIKEVPASFGDSINALTSLPGVIRTFGSFFGPLVIRGMYPDKNRYYIDGMPINNPLHFFGFHSVIANDLMSEIDLYSSSFPAEFGGALAAVIDITTIDSVKEFGGNTDIGLISATALIKTPIKRDVYTEDGKKEEPAGYFIVSGRIGYLSLLVPLFYKLFLNQTLNSVPEYWDYQVKARYYFNRRHSVSVLCLGSSDYFKVLVDEDFVKPEEGDDPLLLDLKFDYDQAFHNQGLYYSYATDYLVNTVMLYSSWSDHFTYVNAGSALAADWLKDLTVDSRPWIIGLKDSFRFNWLRNIAELRGALEYIFYRFEADGKSLRVNEIGFIDPADPDAVTAVAFDSRFSNSVIGGYLDNRFTPGRFEIVPGIRMEHLFGSGYYTIDPRLNISYEFPTETSVSAAGGHYSSFFQTNPFLFQIDPLFADAGDDLEPEKAWHSAFGIEQKLDLYTLSIELFYNHYYNLVWDYSYSKNGKEIRGINSGSLRAYGFEFMVRKDRREGMGGLFGWMSYTLTRSKAKTGLPFIFDQNGDKWLTSDQEQEHSFKLVLGYQLGRHTFSSRFQLYTSFPYTPIIGSENSPPASDRYAPVYDMNNVNSRHFPVDHRLDIRYSYKTGYEWGYVSWYIEVINVYGLWHKSVSQEKWQYNRDYEEGVNPTSEKDEGLSIIPNFGVEVKF